MSVLNMVASFHLKAGLTRCFESSRWVGVGRCGFHNVYTSIKHNWELGSQ